MNKTCFSNSAQNQVTVCVYVCSNRVWYTLGGCASSAGSKLYFYYIYRYLKLVQYSIFIQNQTLILHRVQLMKYSTTGLGFKKTMFKLKLPVWIKTDCTPLELLDQVAIISLAQWTRSSKVKYANFFFPISKRLFTMNTVAAYCLKERNIHLIS